MTPTRSQDLKSATDSDAAPIGPELDESAVETIEYIAEMSLSLRNMSVRIEMPFLAYLLEMVFQEAHCIGTSARFERSAQQPLHQ